VELLAFLVDAQYADVAHVVVTAGVHAAGDVDCDVADVTQALEIIEAALNGFSHGNGLGIGQRAVVTAGATDDVVEQASIGRGQGFFPAGTIQIIEVFEPDI